MSGILAALGSGGNRPLRVSVSRVDLDGTRFNSGTVITSQSTTASVRDGKPPYSGVWVRISGNTEIVNVSLSSTTTFSAFSVGDVTYTAVYVYRVTDNAATVVDSPSVTITLTIGAPS